MPRGSVLCRECRGAPSSCPRGLRGFVQGVAQDSEFPVGPESPRTRFFPRLLRHPPGCQGRLPASGPNPAHPTELTARYSGTFSILRPARHLLSPARPQLWDGAWGCPLRPPERSRASRRVPGVPLPNPEEGGLPLGACRRGPPPPSRPAAPPPELAPRQGLHPRALARLAGPYLVWSPQQPVDPGQLGAEREVLAEREQRRPAGLGEVGAVEWVCVVQELHPASQRGHDASLPLGARAPGLAGPRAGAPGSLRAGEAAAAALWLAGSQAPARRVAARATAAGGRGGGGAGAGGPLGPLLLRLLPFSVPLARSRLPGPT